MKVTDDYLIVGQFLKPVGIKGEMKVLAITDRSERFYELPFIFLKQADSFTKIGLENVRLVKNNVILKLKNLNDRKVVEPLSGQYLYIDRKHAASIGKSSYYYYDLLGCAVKTVRGERIGTLFDIQNNGSCDIYFVRPDKGDREEYLIPAIKDVVKKINIKSKEIVIDIIEGLF
jgi:16S rRNA processing protein RimM